MTTIPAGNGRMIQHIRYHTRNGSQLSVPDLFPMTQAGIRGQTGYTCQGRGKRREEESMSLKDKKVVIIGGSSGIGLASAKAAAAAGAYVLIAGRSQEKLHKALAEIEGEAEASSLDLTRENEVEEFFARIGAIDH